jgi:hypothetical protein
MAAPTVPTAIVGEGEMKGRQIGWWLAGVLAILLGAGCSGVLLESQHEDGRVERLRVEGGESWSTYDDKPRLPQSKSKYEDLGIMLKKESTF